MTNREAREHAELEGQIAALEAEIAGMEAELSNPETFLKLGAATNDFIAKLESKKAELDAKFTRWAELEEIKALE
jgi:ATP-binding cassette subfamily F protein uup